MVAALRAITEDMTMNQAKVQYRREIANSFASHLKIGQSLSINQFATKHRIRRDTAAEAVELLVGEGKFVMHVESRMKLYGPPLEHREPPAQRIFKPLVLDSGMRASMERIKELYVYPSIG